MAFPLRKPATGLWKQLRSLSGNEESGLLVPTSLVLLDPLSSGASFWTINPDPSSRCVRTHALLTALSGTHTS